MSRSASTESDEDFEFPEIDSSKTQLFFGCNPFEKGWRLGNEAIIDDLRFYDRVLSAEEVAQILEYDTKW